MENNEDKIEITNMCIAIDLLLGVVDDEGNEVVVDDVEVNLTPYVRIGPTDLEAGSYYFGWIGEMPNNNIILSSIIKGSSYFRGRYVQREGDFFRFETENADTRINIYQYNNNNLYLYSPPLHPLPVLKGGKAMKKRRSKKRRSKKRRSKKKRSKKRKTKKRRSKKRS